MKTFEDLLRERPELKFRRSLSATKLFELLDRKHGECIWCGSQCKPPRTSWCTKSCYSAFQLRCMPGMASRFVRYRDAGVCQMCFGDARDGEVDHIVPVVLGGGLCELDNLRLLCVVCHTGETAKLNRQLQLRGNHNG